MTRGLTVSAFFLYSVEDFTRTVISPSAARRRGDMRWARCISPVSPLFPRQPLPKFGAGGPTRSQEEPKSLRWLSGTGQAQTAGARSASTHGQRRVCSHRETGTLPVRCLDFALWGICIGPGVTQTQEVVIKSHPHMRRLKRRDETEFT